MAPTHFWPFQELPEGQVTPGFAWPELTMPTHFWPSHVLSAGHEITPTHFWPFQEVPVGQVTPCTFPGPPLLLPAQLAPFQLEPVGQTTEPALDTDTQLVPSNIMVAGQRPDPSVQMQLLSNEWMSQGTSVTSTGMHDCGSSVLNLAAESSPPHVGLTPLSNPPRQYLPLVHLVIENMPAFSYSAVLPICPHSRALLSHRLTFSPIFGTPWMSLIRKGAFGFMLSPELHASVLHSLNLPSWLLRPSFAAAYHPLLS